MGKKRKKTSETNIKKTARKNLLSIYTRIYIKKKKR